MQARGSVGRRGCGTAGLVVGGAAGRLAGRQGVGVSQRGCAVVGEGRREGFSTSIFA